MSNLILNFNWKIFNSALWIQILCIYLLPFETVDEFQYRLGFPMKCFYIYDSIPNFNLFSSTYLNIGQFFTNVFIIYFIIIYFERIRKK